MMRMILAMVLSLVGNAVLLDCAAPTNQSANRNYPYAAGHS